jgi:hypothetical protein
MRRATFGLLCYANTYNLGDEIQSLAVRRFLPQVDHYVDRERLNGFTPADGALVGLVLNGWYCHHPENWPPSAAIVPLLLGIHITREASTRTGGFARDAMLRHPGVRYLQRFGPVGARDLDTLSLLRGAGVNAWFAGCLSLTLPRPPVSRDAGLVVLNEVPASVASHVRGTSRKRIVTSCHADVPTDRAERFRAAERLLALYAGASCVVTSRLHCALPCVAMGTPVFLLDVQPDRYRFAGLDAFFHHGTTGQFVAGEANYDVDDPPAVKQVHLPYRADLIARVTRFVADLQDGRAPRAYATDTRVFTELAMKQASCAS